MPEAACCGRYHRGERAPTAVALMRSRYTAYVRGEIDYLVDTEAGGERDVAGVVEFIARGVTAGRGFVQRERSRFRRVDGAWFYVDDRGSPAGGSAAGGGRGLIDGNAPARSGRAVGRNEPCPCGSGKKYKRCHGG
jgi:SEC-C motif-containing protein